MSAVDLPPGLGLAGTALASFSAPRRARRLASLALWWTLLFAGAAWWGLRHQPYQRHASTIVVLSVSLILVALLGFAVRRATVRIGREGVRWGWRLFSVRQAADRLIEVRVYGDGATLRSPRGHWFLAKRDWDRFEAMTRAMELAELPVVRYEGPAPFVQRMQSYGTVLDGLLVLAALAQAFLATIS